MTVRATLLAGLIAASLPAAACAGDARVRTLPYVPHAIVTVAGRPNVETTILFAPDEHIENVAIGDSAGWQVTPNRRANLLFLKPQGPRGRTNLTVVTDRHTYLFDLVAGGRSAPALYTLQFTYPAAAIPVAAPLSPPPLPPSAPPIVAASLPPPAPDLADLHFDWAAKGSKRLLPQRVFDDGTSLYLAWDPGAALPALLAVAADGTEGPVNTSVKGAFVVVDGVPGRLVLRAGKESATLDRLPAAAVRPARVAER